MATEAKPAQTKLKGLRGRLPAKAPQYLQSDYKTFIANTDDSMNNLNALVTSEDSTAQSRTDYSSKKQALAELKKKVNDAAKVQKDEVAEILGDVSPLNKAASKLLDELKDKKGKDEIALSTAIFQATAALQTISGLEAPSPVD